jgi:predicted RNA-binding protein with PUA-like domain
MARRAKQYWLMKSEPNAYSIDDLERDGSTHWDGVRNYQARNFMRDDMKIGDRVIFYHSNTEPPSAVGVAEVVKESYPDFTAFDPSDLHFDPKSKEEKPTWYMVDIKFVEKFKRPVSLQEMKENPKLQDMKLVQRGNRLSVMPVSKNEFNEILRMSKQK